MSRKNLEFIHIVFNVLSLREFSNILHFHFLFFLFFREEDVSYTYHQYEDSSSLIHSDILVALNHHSTHHQGRWDDDDVNINKENEYTHSEWYNANHSSGKVKFKSDLYSDQNLTNTRVRVRMSEILPKYIKLGMCVRVRSRVPKFAYLWFIYLHMRL